MAAQSFDDLLAAGVAEAIARRPELAVAVGDVSHMLLAGAAAMAEAVLQQANQKFKGTFLDTAEGDELTLRADDRGVQRDEAVSATGVLSFTRPSTAGGGGTITAGTVVATARDVFGTEIQFTTDTDLVFTGADLGPLTVTAAAIVTGTSGSVAAGSITRIVSTVFDSSLSVTNPAGFAGGASEQDDPGLREEVRQLPNTVRRGTLAALEYGAKTVVGVAQATAIEGSGIVNLYIADASGTSSPTLVAAVQTELINWRCAGEVVNAIGASTISTGPILVTLTVRAGVDKTALTANIQAAIVARVAKLKIGEAVTNAQLLQATLNVDSDGITDAAITASLPSPLPNQLTRCVAGDITVA